MFLAINHTNDVTVTSMFKSQIFPNYTANSRPASKNSALAKIKAKRAAVKQLAALTNSNRSDALPST